MFPFCGTRAPHVQRLRLEQEQDVVAGARGGAATKKWHCVDSVSVNFRMFVAANTSNIPYSKVLCLFR